MILQQVRVSGWQKFVVNDLVHIAAHLEDFRLLRVCQVLKGEESVAELQVQNLLLARLHEPVPATAALSGQSPAQDFENSVEL